MSKFGDKIEKLENERAFWVEFIELYESKPVLWKVKSDIYKNRSLKRIAYEEMSDKLREIYTRADTDLVKKKINSLRSCYRREMRKMHEFHISNKGTDDEYEPTWWCFDRLSFLRDQEDPLEEKPLIEEYNTILSPPHKTKKMSVQPELLNRSGRQHNKLKAEVNPGGGYVGRKKLLQMAYKHLQHNNDENEILGKCWIFQYRDLPEDQKIFAKKAIDDVLFEAKLGTLHRYSVKINDKADD